MAVTASGPDNRGKNLDNKITTLTALTAPAGTALAASIAASIDQAQREAVEHYISCGRISAAAILSTLS